MKIISRRVGNIIDIGNSIGLTIRQELLDLHLNADDPVNITVEESDGGNRVIVIEKRKGKPLF